MRAWRRRRQRNQLLALVLALLHQIAPPREPNCPRRDIRPHSRAPYPLPPVRRPVPTANARRTKHGWLVKLLERDAPQNGRIPLQLLPFPPLLLLTRPLRRGRERGGEARPLGKLRVCTDCADAKCGGGACARPCSAVDRQFRLPAYSRPSGRRPGNPTASTLPPRNVCIWAVLSETSMRANSDVFLFAFFDIFMAIFDKPGAGTRATPRIAPPDPQHRRRALSSTAVAACVLWSALARRAVAWRGRAAHRPRRSAVPPDITHARQRLCNDDTEQRGAAHDAQRPVAAPGSPDTLAPPAPHATQRGLVADNARIPRPSRASIRQSGISILARTRRMIWSERRPGGARTSWRTAQLSYERRFSTTMAAVPARAS